MSEVPLYSAIEAANGSDFLLARQLTDGTNCWTAPSLCPPPSLSP